MTDRPALAIYAANAAEMARRYEDVSARSHFAPVADLFPAPPARAADIGAGSGRDAAWLMALGHAVTAAEPVAELRAEARRLHPELTDWLDDGLPDLAGLRARAPFDLLTLSAVWHHLPPTDRPAAMVALSAAMAPGGVLAMSLRDGPAMPERGVFACDAGGAVDLAAAAGLGLLRRVRIAPDQPDNRHAGIGWIWLVFSRMA